MTRWIPTKFFTLSAAAPAGGDGARPFAGGTRLRRIGAAAAVACAMALAGCGGGGEADVAVVQGAGLQVDVVAGSTTYAPVLQGQALDVSASIGQSIVFDANEPVVWSFAANGSPLFANGTTVDVGGVTLTETQVSPSRVVFDSAFYGPALVPVNVLLTATSTIDNAQVATIHLVLQ